MTLDAAGDTFVVEQRRQHNFGARPHLRAGDHHESLVQFDLGGIPASAAIDSATLGVYVVDYDSHSPVDIHRITAPWSELDVTYTTFAQHFDPTVLAGFTAAHDRSHKSIDMTAQVRRWATGAQPNYGVLLETPSRHQVTMVSREGGIASERPQLTVCYSVPDDHCSPDPCKNGGTCDNDPSGFTCHCAAGYTGPTCETSIDNCAGAPCQNGGVCSSDPNGYTCACPAGYTGTNCETLIDNCAGGPCQNGGICENEIGGFVCHCAIGYTGTTCDQVVDSCAPAPCQNGGTCTNGIGTYTCSCPTGFTGVNCEINIDDCASQPCQNGGTCIDGIDAYTCACPPTWGGATCEVNLDMCALQPCLNGGTCNDGYGIYTCDCAAGFTGTNCEIDINDCAGSPCQHGGVCVDGVNSYTCQCPPGYTGTNCGQFGCATALDGTPCDDGNACTQVDSCQGGVCTGTSPITCTALDQCHAAGVCDPLTAVCSNPPLADGASCSDGNGCTTDDVCVAGACASGTPLACDGTCDPQNGVCTLFPPIAVSAASVGFGLETPLTVTLGQAAPAMGVTISVTSANPTQVLLATSPTSPGSANVIVTVAAGDVSSATPIYVQAVGAIGTADVVASAPGYASQTATIALVPSAFFVLQGSFTTGLTPDTPLTILAAPVVGGARGIPQPLRGGTSVDVLVASSDPRIGALTVDPVHFSAGDSQQVTAFHPIAGGSTTLSVNQPSGFATPTTGAQLTATVTAPAVALANVTVGQNLQVTESASLGTVAPPGGVTVTIASADPSRMVVSASATTAGSGSITLTVPAGSSTIPAFFVQGLAASGTVGLTASAAGFTAQTATVTLSPSGIFLFSSNISTTTLSRDTSLTILSALIVNGQRGTGEAVRGGLDVATDVTSSNPAVGTLTISPVHIAGGSNTATTAFHPVGIGVTTLTAGTPPGFSTPTVGAQISATVSAPTFVAANPQVGKDLELAQNDQINAPAPAGGVAVTITSEDPSRVLVASNAASAGSPSIVITVPAGATAIPTFFVQALAGTGTATIMLSAAGFTPQTATVTMVTSSLFLFTGNISTTAHSADTSITILSAPLINGNRASSQPVRGGLSVSVDIASSSPSIGTVTVSPVVFTGGASSGTTSFHPVAAGTTTVGITIPPGFSSHALENQITATVTP